MCSYSATRYHDKYMVKRTSIIGTNVLLYSVYERTAPLRDALYGHGTITYTDGQPWGDITTRTHTRVQGEQFDEFLDRACWLREQSIHEMERIAKAVYPEVSRGERKGNRIEVEITPDNIPFIEIGDADAKKYSNNLP